MPLLRQARLPKEVRNDLVRRFEPGEHVIGWGRGAGDSPGDEEYLVATDHGLWYGAGDGLRTRLRWEDVARAGWDDPVLDVRRNDGTRQAFRLAQPRDLPAVVRDRVTASVVISSYSRLSGGGGVRVVARRRAGGDGLLWSLVFDRSADAENPALRAEAERLLDEARASVGE